MAGKEAAGRPLRILHVLWVLHPYHPEGGGIAVAGYHLGAELVKRGHEIHIAVLDLAVGPPMRLPTGCTVHPLGAKPGRGWVSFLPLARLLCLVRRLQPALLHAQPLATGPSVWAALVKTLTGVPYVTTDQGMLYVPLRGPRRWLSAWTLRKADGVIALTADMKDRMRRLTHCTPAVIPNGVSPSLLQPGWEKPATQGALRVVYGGRLDPDKGVDVLLQGFVEVGRRFPECALVIYGDGPERERLVSQSKALGLEARVAFKGMLAHEDFTAALREATIMVLPTWREGLPLSVVEAFACGVPVVVSAVGGIPELVTHEENGLLVPPGDAAALARAIVQLLEDPHLRAQMSQANREKAKLFSWEYIAELTEGVYYQALGNTSRRENGQHTA